MKLKDILSRFKKGRFIRRVLFKTIIGPRKYGKGNDYDAARYWHDRFSKYGQSLKGAGDEGLSEEENLKMYAEAAKVFTDLCRREGVDFQRLSNNPKMPEKERQIRLQTQKEATFSRSKSIVGQPLQSVSVLEIGCGTGFYTQLLHNLGVKNYVGVDITDVLFPELRKKFPKFRFIRKDITSDRIEGKFDLIVMIDVIEHIVKGDKLSFAMANVKNSLSEDGFFIITPIMDVSKKQLFYVRVWSLEDIKRRFPGYIFRELVPFRNSNVLIIRKP